MQLQLRNRVIVLIGELILQSRIHLKSDRFKKLDNFHKQIVQYKESAFKENIDILLDSLLIAELYDIGKTIENLHLQKSQNLSIKIVFFLKQRQSHSTNIQNNVKAQIIEVQAWQIIGIQKENTHKNELQNDLKDFTMLLYMFQQLITLINHRPLFSIYQNNKELKNKYQIIQKTFIEEQTVNNRKLFYQKKPWQNNNSYCAGNQAIFYLPTYQRQIRQSENLSFEIRCRFLKDLQCLLEKSTYKKNTVFDDTGSKQGMFEDRRRKESINLSTEQEEKPNKVYQFYDQKLDFTFISSDNEVFGNVENKNNLIQHDLASEGSDGQFELLILNEDQKFLDENQSLFICFKQFQCDYL